MLTAAACAPSVRRFPLRAPLWVDADRNHVPVEPKEYYSGLIADGADKTFFYPLAELWTFPLEREAINANAFDEVPNSAWFENRIGLFDLSTEEAARGACLPGDELDPERGPWVVWRAKPNGANPGFFIKAPNGKRYLLKFDGAKQPARATTADVIGSKIYWAAGYHTPCNEIVYFPEDLVVIGKDANMEDSFGEKIPITAEAIDRVFEGAFRLNDGRIRASASLFVPGKPLGPFTYQGTRGDDPNDVVPHEHRRELRGSYVFAAWINHFDSREQNTLDVWIEEKNGRNYVRHYFLDWGDSLGSRWPLDQVSRRLGRSYYLDFEHVFVDLVSLGVIARPWQRVELQEQEIFGYFDVETFEPDDYHPGYLNPAFAERTDRDVAWGARILARFTPEHVRAIVKTAKLPDPRQEDWLAKQLVLRQKKILQAIFSRTAPLGGFQMKHGSRLCFEDYALMHEVATSTRTLYKMRFYGGEELEEPLGWRQLSPEGAHPYERCVELPIGRRRPAELVPPDAPDDHPLRYGVLKIFVHTMSLRPNSELDLHFYDLGEARGFRLVGVDRPEHPVVPASY
jgi:hypothetical protein